MRVAVKVLVPIIFTFMIRRDLVRHKKILKEKKGIL
jgi:hypothetical protein